MTDTPRTTPPGDRHGTVLIIVVVLLLIVMMIAGQIVHSLLLGARRLEEHHETMQAVRMAESGLRRARARLLADPAYTGQTLQPHLPAGPAKIVISIDRKEGKIAITSRATFPAGAERPARVTRSATVGKDEG